MTHSPEHYPDTEAVAEFMRAFGQPVRTAPTADLPDAERLLRVRLVVEEALEFAEAMGCTVWADRDGRLTPKGAHVELAEGTGIDLVESADALADLIVVTKGSAHSLGIDLDAVFDLVHETNMAKLGPNGEVVFVPGTNKVGKPEGWKPPTEAISRLLADAVAQNEYDATPELREALARAAASPSVTRER